jgi:hypothetical protein
MKIQLKSGFESGGSAWSFCDDGGWVLRDQAYANTWAGDGDTSCEVEIGPRGAEYWWGGRVYKVTLHGFSAAELAAPSSIKGFRIDRNHGESVPVRVDCFHEEAIARLAGETLISDEELVARATTLDDGRLAAELPHSWGAQEAAAFAVFQNGTFEEMVSGVGDQTPYIDIKGRLTDDLEYRDEDKTAQIILRQA